MSGVSKIEIKESEEELKKRWREQKTVSGQERIQVLYLLKTARTVKESAEIIGRNRVTVQKWLRKYKEEGIEGLLEKKERTGRPRKIPEWAEKALEKRLSEEEGFESYGEICRWLSEKLGIEAKYETVHKLVRYKLKGKPKIARPRDKRQSKEKVKEFKEKFTENIVMLCWVIVNVMKLGNKIRFFCADETRLGLKTISGRKITKRGVKPIGEVEWKFKATYLYGAVEPKTGESFFYEFSHLNGKCFEKYLELLSEQYADSILIIQLDNGRFHKGKDLKVPSKIILMFQPPYAPELNPIEQVWQYLKRGLRWKLPANLDELRVYVIPRLNEMTEEVIASITGRQFILDALSVARL